MGGVLVGGLLGVLLVVVNIVYVELVEGVMFEGMLLIQIFVNIVVLVSLSVEVSEVFVVLS